MAQPVSQGGIDYPDGGLSASGIIFALLDDLGELAARLGSPVTYNREGITTHVETFEGGLQPWKLTSSGSGAEHLVSNEKFRISPYSAKLIAGSTDGYHATMLRRFPHPGSGAWGMEFSLLICGYVEYVQWLLDVDDGTINYQYWLQYRVVEEDIQIWTGSTWLTIIEDVMLYYPQSDFAIIKSVIDLDTTTYERVIVNADEYNEVADYAPIEVAGGYKGSIGVTFKVLGEDGENGAVYIDALIITWDEATR